MPFPVEDGIAAVVQRRILVWISSIISVYLYLKITDNFVRVEGLQLAFGPLVTRSEPVAVYPAHEFSHFIVVLLYLRFLRFDDPSISTTTSATSDGMAITSPRSR